MVDNQSQQSNSNASEEQKVAIESPLGIKDSLLPSNPLGQNFLSPKFLSPLGANPLVKTDFLALSNQEIPDYSLSENSFDGSLSASNESLTVQTALETPSVVEPLVQAFPVEEQTNSEDIASSSESTPIETSSVVEPLVQAFPVEEQTNSEDIASSSEPYRNRTIFSCRTISSSLFSKGTNYGWSDRFFLGINTNRNIFSCRTSSSSFSC